MSIPTILPRRFQLFSKIGVFLSLGCENSSHGGLVPFVECGGGASGSLSVTELALVFRVSGQSSSLANSS